MSSYEEALKICKGKKRLDVKIESLTKEILIVLSIHYKLTFEETIDKVFREYFEEFYNNPESLYKHICLVYPNKRFSNNKIKEYSIDKELIIE